MKESKNNHEECCHHEHEECCHHEHHKHEDHDDCCCHHEHHKHKENCHHKHEDHDDCCCHHEHHDDECGCGHSHKNKKESIFFFIRLGLSICFLIVSLILKDINLIAHNIILTVSYLIISYDILLSAIKNILKGKVFNENFLMTLASLTAIIVYIVNPNQQIDGFDGVLVIILYQFGEYIQHKAVDKSKQSLMKMMDLDVNSVIVIKDDKEEVINIKDINIDDIIKILPGEKIVTDGIIVEGSSSINTSMLTGESKPLEVYKGDKVNSGCINNDGIIYVKALTKVEDSTSFKVKKMIQDASKNKATSEKFITKFAKYYTPIVIFISLFVIFIIPLILGFKENFYTYLYKGLAIMVISCPCALVISIPLSYFVAIGKCAKESILVKGSSYIEQLAKTKTIAFDKTGTITKGNFKIIDLQSSEEKLMKELLYSCEKNFTHPIAKSIKEYLLNTNEISVEDIKNIPGYGLKATYENKEILIGNEKLLRNSNVSFEKIDSINTIIYVSYDNKYLGYITIADEIKSNVLQTINELKEKYNVYLISGDKKEIVLKVASDVNIDNCYYEMLPEDKVNIINSLKEKEKVTYVGDGINDAACLLNSDCGIAMKSLGSDIAITASDIVIMDDNISSVSTAIKIAKKTMKVVIWNIILSILIKVIVMVLAMVIFVPMFVAIIADVGVCLIAILNTLTIRFTKTNKK